jgi:proliferating cell nuclear antigen
MKLITMDGARVALIHLRLDADNFQEYSCPGLLQCGINMSNMYKLLRTVSTHDTIILTVPKANTNEMHIQTFNSDKNTKTTFTLKLLDVNSENISIPAVQFDTVLTLPSTYLQRLCRDMYNLSDIMTVLSRDNQLLLRCTGDFASQETIISECEECMSLQMQSNVHIENNFSLKYLTLFCRASSLSSTVEIYLKENYPLILQYSVAGLGCIRFCLAPKMDM